MKKRDMEKRILFSLLATIFLVFIISFTSAVCYGGMSGDGSSGSPCLITNCTQLNETRNNLNAYYQLQNNINCSDTKNWDSGAGWERIGNDTNPFIGNFNGQGYNISGIYFNRSVSTYQGLFGYINNSIISNVNLIDFSGTDDLGRAGGLVGNIYLNSTISNSSVSGNLSTSSVEGRIGLLVGRIGTDLPINTEVYINNCHTSGKINSSGITSGGIIGLVSSGCIATINNSYSDANVYSSNYSIGGLAGQFLGNIYNSYATGNVNSTQSNIGGLVGYFSGNIYNSYATGNVTCPTTSGGLVGSLMQGNIYNSYATGTVTGSTYIGGLVGYYNTTGSTSVTNSSWDINTTGRTNMCGFGTCDNSYGKTTLQMKNISSYSGWNITTTPTYLNNGYPFLSWQVLENSYIWEIFEADNTNPSVLGLSPTGELSYLLIGQTTQLNYSISDLYLNSCWFEYNSANNSISCSENSSFTHVSGINSGRIWANDTSGNINSYYINWSYSSAPIIATAGGGGGGGSSITPINLESINLSSKDWVIGQNNYLYIETLDTKGNRTDISSINITNQSFIYYQLQRLSTGYYLANIKLNKSVQNITLEVIANDNGKTVTKKISINLREKTFLDTIKPNTNEAVIKIDSWIEDNKILFWTSILITIIGLIMISAIIYYLKK